MLFKSITVASLLAGAVSATTHRVDVGANGTLTFVPDSVTAAVGDVIEYHFYGKNHSVVQGAFNTPCQTGSVTDGFYSGFIPVSGKGESNQVFQVTVTDTTPQWVYCSQGKHCPLGMVAVINPPASGPNTLEAYTAGAKRFNGTVNQPANVQGGVIVTSNSTGVSSGSGSGSSNATTTGGVGSGSGSGNATITGSAPKPTFTTNSAATLGGSALGAGIVAVAMLFL